MKKFYLLIITLFSVTQLFAQTTREVAGIVRDTAGVGIIGATIKLTPLDAPTDTMLTRTTEAGVFLFKGVKTSQFTLTVSSLGYNSAILRSVNPEGTSRISIGLPIILKTKNIVLNQVTINGAAPVTIKEDTIEYNAASFNMKENTVAEDLIKKLDGMDVDRNGNITSQGKPVTRVRVNGKDFFGGDVKTATRNIPAKAIDKVQVINDYGDQANFTGVKDGDPETVLNITTRPGMSKGLLANGTLGGGSEERYQLSGFGTQIEGERNLGLTANINNNGAQIGGLGFGGRGGPSGVTSVNASGGSGGFGASDGGGGANSGITTLGSVGLNYSDRWSKKLTITAGYFYTSSDNSTISNTNSENLTSKGTLFSIADADRATDSHAHNMNARIQYTMSKTDQFTISPSVGFTSGGNTLIRTNLQTGVSRQDQLTNSKNKLNTPSIGGNALYTHVFKKPGRNYSLNVGARTNGIDSENDNLNRIKYYNTSNALVKDSLDHRLNAIDNQTLLTAVRFIHTEPLNKTTRLQFSYNMNYNHYDNSRITNLANTSGVFARVDSLSNIFDYSFTSHQFGVNFAYRNKGDDLTLGASANPAYLSGSSPILKSTIKRTNFYVAPILRYVHTYSRTKNIQVTYASRAGEPTFSQLQPVRDISDPQRQTVGNPNLNSSFSHTVNANYNTSNPAKRSSFMLRFQGSLTNDRIVQNIVLIPDAYSNFKREIRYLNADGAYSYSGGYNWQKSTADRHYTVRLNGSAGFDRNITFADNLKNRSGSWSARQGVGMQINPGTWLEFSPNFSYSLSSIDYTLQGSRDIKIQTYTIDVDGNIFFLKSRSLIWRFNGVKNFNSGYSGSFNVNPLVVNSSVEKAFLKDRSATMKLQAFDLFNQSNNINRNLQDNGFADISTNRLTQYFMLTLTMRMNRMSGGSPAPAAGGQRAPGQGGAGGGQRAPGGGAPGRTPGGNN